MATMSDTHIDLRQIHNLGDTRELLVSCPACERQGILLAGISRAGPGFEFCRPHPGMNQVLACLGGRGVVLVDGTWCELTAGQAYCTPAHCRHHYRHQGRGVWLLAWVVFDATVAVAPPAPSRLPGDARPLHDAIRNLHRELIGAADSDLVTRWSDLVAACAQRLARPQAAGHQRLAPVWQAVADDLAHPWTLTELAELASLSSEHLRRLCRADTGRSPMQQVAWLRLHHARQQLALAETPIATIAARVGYANAFAFSTAFRRLWGCPPSACR